MRYLMLLLLLAACESEPKHREVFINIDKPCNVGDGTLESPFCSLKEMIDADIEAGLAISISGANKHHEQTTVCFGSDCESTDPDKTYLSTEVK